MNKNILLISTGILLVGVLCGAIASTKLMLFVSHDAQRGSVSDTPLVNSGASTSVPQEKNTDLSAQKCVVKNLVLSNLKEGDEISFPFHLKGTVDNRVNANCAWVVFEGQAGPMQVLDVDGKVIADGVLSVQGDWMSEGPLTVEGLLTKRADAKSPALTLIINDDNPSGRTPQEISMPLILKK